MTISIFCRTSYILLNLSLGCSTKPVEIANNIEILHSGTDLMGRFQDELEAFFLEKETECGPTNTPEVLRGISERANVYFCSLANLLRDFRHFFRCSNWYPLYDSLVHQSVCYGASDAFSWIASTQCIVVFGAIIVLTFRAAFFDIEVTSVVEVGDDGVDEIVVTTNENGLPQEKHATKESPHGERCESKADNQESHGIQDCTTSTLLVGVVESNDNGNTVVLKEEVNEEGMVERIYIYEC